MKTARSMESDEEIRASLGPLLVKGSVTAESVRTSLPVAWVEHAMWGGVRSVQALAERYVADVRPDATVEQALVEIEAALMLAAATKVPGPKGDDIGLFTPKAHAFFSSRSPGDPVHAKQRRRTPPFRERPVDLLDV